MIKWEFNFRCLVVIMNTDESSLQRLLPCNNNELELV